VNKRLRTVEISDVGARGESAPLTVLICQKFGKILKNVGKKVFKFLHFLNNIMEIMLFCY